jgi:hypothetical protein
MLVALIEEEVRAAVRRGGLGSLSEAQAVILETERRVVGHPAEQCRGSLSAFTDFEDVLQSALG